MKTRSPCEIRALTRTDEPFLWEMLYQAIYLPPGHPPLPRAIVQQPEIRRYVEGWGRRNDWGLLALVNGKSVGAVWLRLLVGNNKGFGYVDERTPELSLALLPEYRSQGIGSRLFAEFLRQAPAHCVAVCLSVSTGNPAQRLYERFGFIPVTLKDSAQTMIRYWS
jgi:GNAT superfamily N-acetyltransferase